MTINFRITNTTSSEVILKVDEVAISSQFVSLNDQAEFSLDSDQVINAISITLENSDVIYDITDMCKRKINDYVKPVIKVDPDSGVFTTQKTKVSDIFKTAKRSSKPKSNPSVNGFGSNHDSSGPEPDDKFDFEAYLKDDSWYK